MSLSVRFIVDRLIASPARLVAVLFATALLVSLGTWQLYRLEWKCDLVRKIEERIGAEPAVLSGVFTAWRNDEDMEYTPVSVEGVYRHDLETHVFGSYEGAPGYYVFTPVALSEGSGVGAAYVYVNRGFVPQALKKAGGRADGLVAEKVRIAGYFRAPERPRGLAGMLKPPNDVVANVWHARTPEAFAAASGLDAAPVYIDSFGTENTSAWPKGGVTRITFTNRHFEYALTWFGLAGALWAVFLAYAFTRK